MPHLTERLADYVRLMRLHRPIGAFLLLWPTLWGIWIASEGRPDPLVLVVFVAGVFLMRSAGCVINDYADRDFDGHVERTKNRPLATKSVSPREALLLAGSSLGAALGKVKAGELLAHVAGQIGGKGGGRPDMAQGGGEDGPQLVAALDGVPGWVKPHLA